MKRFTMLACALLIASVFSPTFASAEIGNAVSAQDFTFAAYDDGPVAAVASVGDVAQASRLAHAERERVSYLSDSAISHDAMLSVGAYVAASPLAVGGWPS